MLRNTPFARPSRSSTPAGRHSQGWCWLRTALVCIAILGGGIAIALYEDPSLVPQAVDVARALVGPQPVALVESWVFQAQDSVRQARYQATGAAPQVRWAAPPAATPAQAAGAAPGVPAAATSVPSSAGAGVVPAWAPFVYTPSGAPALDRALIAPDPTRPYVETALVRVDLRAAQLHLVAGTQEPQSDVRAARPGSIPAADQRAGYLLAAFNGGFKAANGAFGMGVGKTTLLPPLDGLATLAIYRDGSVRLGVWGSDMQATPDMVAFRQNCPLLLDHGELTSDATSDDPALWGKTVKNKIATWRSGLGLSADGRFLYYAAGDGLTVPALAQALADAGADRAMQLDINSWWTRFVTYAPGTGGRLAAQKLLADMIGDTRQFLAPDQRDFFYLTAR